MTHQRQELLLDFPLVQILDYIIFDMLPAGFEDLCPMVQAFFLFQLVEPDISRNRYQKSLDARVPPELAFPYQLNKGYDGFLENVFPILETTAHRYHVEADQFRILLIDMEDNLIQVIGKNSGQYCLIRKDILIHHIQMLGEK